MRVSPEDQAMLVELAEDLGLDVLSVETALDIDHDRVHNNSIAEVIELAAEQDDAEWIEYQLRHFVE